MKNHFHLAIETPRGNLVTGMKWLLGTYTMRYNLRHKGFGWSSYPLYLASSTKRPSWLRVDRLLGEWGIQKDSPAGRRAFSEKLKWRRKEELKDKFRAVERGWCLGTEEFRRELLEQVALQARPTHSGADVRESDAAKAERITQEALNQLGWTDAGLQARRKGDTSKITLARKLRRETTMTQAWIANRLMMGTSNHLAHLLWRSRKSCNTE